jgi:corrinoid protein of di/trimethylamine methyltransferase
LNSLEQLLCYVENGDNEEAKDLAKKLLEEGYVPEKIIEALTEGMRRLGELFEKNEIFLPEMLVAADALSEVMEIVEPMLTAGELSKKKKVVLGTVAGDLHEIGKNLVCMVLKANNYEVIDLGVDVSVNDFINTAEQEMADVIGMSSLMTTTMGIQKEVIDRLQEERKRDKYKVIVGGAPINQRWAEQIGADAYCDNAFEVVKYLNSL